MLEEISLPPSECEACPDNTERGSETCVSIFFRFLLEAKDR